ncbi:Protein of unknown function [Meinhardsimonia xiamenensis]|jgi:hypothetical protein|uniref:DUF1499 domain-containing protein n=1 Tax=Meinhardsimonia xiamenensis TaxID=990712 RepID=A0A1G9FMF6_9RHOB|nr:DUF1499 domain-containing protein [Meinhardsimonia xiamenensis]PRX37772.1 uncharacterized protein DUF1499 [Meinhardsimonia xiamenensis]SDK89535.1 Protein of unknown function [Meinhardsimonia xiamenensis]
MKLALVILLVAAVALMAYVRLAPSPPGRWHVDPLTAPLPGAGGVALRPGSPDGQTPVWPVPPAALLAAFAAHVEATTPRITRLAGSPEEGRITWIVRSRVFGFPDYVTVSAFPADGGAALAILSRLRFGRSDLGVNRARVKRWLEGFNPPPT